MRQMKQADIKYGEPCEKNEIIKQENRSLTKRIIYIKDWFC